MTQHRPTPIPHQLQPYVKNVWAIELDGSDNTERSLSIFADGCPGLFFHESETGLFLGPEKKKLAGTFLYGQTVKPVTLTTSGRCRVLVVNLFPHVLKSLFRFNAKEITDECLDIGLLPSPAKIDLAEQLANTPATDGRITVFFDYLYALINRNYAEPDKALQFATSQLVMNSETSLKNIQTSLNLTERTLQRRFEENVGIPPKLFFKIAQFHTALNQLQSEKTIKLTDIAYANGYADQAHFIRSFKKFTGQSPLSFQRQSSNWMANTIAEF